MTYPTDSIWVILLEMPQFYNKCTIFAILTRITTIFRRLLEIASLILYSDLAIHFIAYHLITLLEKLSRLL